MDFKATSNFIFMYACYNHKCHTVHKGNSKKVARYWYDIVFESIYKIPTFIIFYVVAPFQNYLPVMIWI